MMPLPILLIALAWAPPAETVRFATFNASLNRSEAGALVRDLSTPENVQAGNVAEVIQRVAPDVLLINEFDYDSQGRASALFQTNYLSISRNGTTPIVYPYHYSAPVNTGVPSGQDLDGDGQVETEPGRRGYGNDCLGFGLFPGQYGMVVYSKYPIDAKNVVSFQKLLWKDMPGALLPTRPDGSTWYSPQALEVLRISSKSHWDVPIDIHGTTVHLLVSHPTPPAFDGSEDRNGKRNHDEIRLWADYLTGGPRAQYLGVSGPPPEPFVLMGDQNADPLDGGSTAHAIDQLLRHPKINASYIPSSAGGEEASHDQGGVNAGHQGRPRFDTADFSDREPGNLRVDYVLPSRTLKVEGGGIFWPTSHDPLHRLVAMDPVATSDHRLVFLDLLVPKAESSQDVRK